MKFLSLSLLVTLALSTNAFSEDRDQLQDIQAEAQKSDAEIRRILKQKPETLRTKKKINHLMHHEDVVLEKIKIDPETMAKIKKALIHYQPEDVNRVGRVYPESQYTPELQGKLESLLSPKYAKPEDEEIRKNLEDIVAASKKLDESQGVTQTSKIIFQNGEFLRIRGSKISDDKLIEFLNKFNKKHFKIHSSEVETGNRIHKAVPEKYDQQRKAGPAKPSDGHIVK